MAEHPNERLARDAFDAIARGDVEWLTAHMHEDVVFHQGGRFPTAGTYEGRDAVFAHMLAFFELSAESDRTIADTLKRARENLLALVGLWQENEAATHPSYERYKAARALFLETEDELLAILGDDVSVEGADPIEKLRRLREIFLTELSDTPEDNLYQQG